MSFRLLEISILLAHDLAPVSKLLHTFAVAWVHPEHKLNVSWLRHIPVGTAHGHVSTLLPPPPANSLSLSRYAAPRVPSMEPSIAALTSSAAPGGFCLLIAKSPPPPPPVAINGAERREQLRRRSRRTRRSENYDGREAIAMTNHRFSVANSVNLRTRNRRIPRTESYGGHEAIDPSRFSSTTNLLFSAGVWSISSLSVRFDKSKGTPGSISSYYMRPLPSKVAAEMAKKLYSTTPQKDIRSSILENWTVVGDGCEFQRTKSKVVRWKNADEYGPASENNLSKKKSNGWGLLSCFGTLYGYDCNNIYLWAHKIRTSTRT